jgi:hypothetical protein
MIIILLIFSKRIYTVIFNEKNKSSLIGKWAIIGKNSIFIKELFNINLALIQLLKF